MNKLFYTFYNELITEDQQSFSRFKDALFKLFSDTNKCLIIAKGKQHTNENSFDKEFLFKKIKSSSYMELVYSKNDVVVIKADFDIFAIHDIYEILSFYGNLVILETSSTNNVDVIKESRSNHFFDFRPIFSLLKYRSLIDSGVEINNIQHHFSVLFPKENISLEVYFDKYGASSNEYNLGLTPVKKIID